jgi:cytochrome c-type biogenesis protein CcmH/NrfG
VVVDEASQAYKRATKAKPTNQSMVFCIGETVTIRRKAQ